jgi:glycosyltransferase involved in cell wall biosynthesis
MIDKQPMLKCVALLGRQDEPTDGVRDYCKLLSQAFARRGTQLEIVALRWEIHGWRKALGVLWKASRGWEKQTVMLQYTALMWSRRGFPVGALAVLAILKIRGVRLCVVFHDAGYAPARGAIRQLRVGFQNFTIRTMFRGAEIPVLTVPASQLDWLPRRSHRAVFIPVGANFPPAALKRRDSLPEIPTVAVFGVTGGAHIAAEAEAIAHVISRAAAAIPRLRLNVFGRGALEAEAALRSRLSGKNVEINVEGVLAADEVRERLCRADVLLFVRGQISSRRGSAIAGIACGLPVAGYRGPETAAPITDAGVMLVESGNQDALAQMLVRILSDERLYRGLCEWSAMVAERDFSWDAIASKFAEAFSGTGLQSDYGRSDDSASKRTEHVLK